MVRTHAAIIKSINLHVITTPSHNKFSTIPLLPNQWIYSLAPSITVYSRTMKGTGNARGQMQSNFGLNHNHCNHCVQPGGGNF